VFERRERLLELRLAHASDTQPIHQHGSRICDDAARGARILRIPDALFDNSFVGHHIVLEWSWALRPDPVPETVKPPRFPSAVM